MKKLSLTMGAFLLIASILACGVSAADMFVEAECTPIVSVEVPTGGGNKDIMIISDGNVGTGAGDTEQYDTYCNMSDPKEDYFGYTFPVTHTVKEVVFVEGNHFNNGGWFEMGLVRVEALVGGEWKDVGASCDPEYPVGLIQDEFGEGYEEYTFDFEPIACDGIRVIGTAGGSAVFISCAELKVLAEVADDYVVTDIRDAAAAAAKAERDAKIAEGYISLAFTPFTSITAPTGGGNKDINVINDGEWLEEDESNSGKQYDTYIGNTEPQEAYFGYEFDGKTYTVDEVIFHEGMQFGDGGWYSEGLKVQALQGGEWKDVDASCDPAYPVSDTGDDHTPGGQTYTFTLGGVACEGIRIDGMSNTFVSVSELTVKGAEAAAEVPVAEDAPAAEEEPAVEEVAEEIVVEEPVVTEEAPAAAAAEEAVEEAPAAAEAAPQTFDCVIFAAVAAIVSACGYTVSKKH